MSIQELRAELLQTEYPFLRPDHDPDIERYYELRNLGRSVAALTLYQTKLKRRYPDDEIRTRILRSYRQRDPQYGILLASAYHNLGDRLLERTKRTIKYIALKVESYDASDAYATIKTAESILEFLPREPFEAIGAIERLHLYAQKLDYRVPSMAKAEALLRAYLNQNLTVVEEELQRRRSVQREALERQRRSLVEKDKRDLEKQMEAYRHRMEQTAVRRPGPVKNVHRPSAPLFDLSTIRFSATDLARIQIPPTLTKVEDKTLAYCFKYWNLVFDQSFERVLFLYSRKYGTKHYDIFTTIQRGRRAGHRDDEILASVMAQLITGYYYSIRGDIYLQRNWAILKKKYDKATAPRGINLGGTVVKNHRRSSGSLRPAGLSPSVTAPSTRSPPAVAPVHPIAPNLPPATIKSSPGQGGASSLVPPPPLPSTRGTKPAGSVADRLRRLSGRSYDVYQDLFLAKVRGAIRRILNPGHGIFSNLPVEAEDLVFTFLKTHYSDPYMNWETSDARIELAKLGFALESVDPIIEECYKEMMK